MIMIFILNFLFFAKNCGLKHLQTICFCAVAVANKMSFVDFPKIILDLQKALNALSKENENTQNELVRVDARVESIAAHDTELLELPWEKLVSGRWYINFESHKNMLLNMPECTLENIQQCAQQFYCFLRNQLTSCPELTLSFKRNPELVNKYVVEITGILLGAFRVNEIEDSSTFVELAIQNLSRAPFFWNDGIA